MLFEPHKHRCPQPRSAVGRSIDPGPALAPAPGSGQFRGDGGWGPSILRRGNRTLTGPPTAHRPGVPSGTAVPPTPILQFALSSKGHPFCQVKCPSSITAPLPRALGTNWKPQPCSAALPHNETWSAYFILQRLSEGGVTSSPPPPTPSVSAATCQRPDYFGCPRAQGGSVAASRL